MSWFFGIKEKLIALGLGALAILGYIWKIKRDAEAKGRKEIVDKVNAETQRKKDEWQKIDDTPLGVDDALSRLRKRASRNDGNS